MWFLCLWHNCLYLFIYTLSGLLEIYFYCYSYLFVARVFAFLSGPPDYGAGQLDTRRYGEQYASKREDADRALLPEQTPFYKDLVRLVELWWNAWHHTIWFVPVLTEISQATVAVESGVCVDIFAVTNEYTDLASLKFLSIESGGSLLLYASTDDSTLPQDMYVFLVI